MGNHIEPGLPNITGGFFASSTVGFRDVRNGAFVCDLETELANYIAPSSSYKGYPIKFDASRESSIYGQSTTVQPLSISCYLEFYIN